MLNTVRAVKESPIRQKYQTKIFYKTCRLKISSSFCHSLDFKGAFLNYRLLSYKIGQFNQKSYFSCRTKFLSSREKETGESIPVVLPWWCF